MTQAERKELRRLWSDYNKPGVAFNEAQTKRLMKLIHKADSEGDSPTEWEG